MAKQTKALSGPAKRKFLLSVVAAEPGVDRALAQRLTDRLDGRVAQVRVRQHGANEAAPFEPTPPDVELPFEPAPAPTAAPIATVFDPHGFSLVVVMTKLGAAGLMQRLETIDDAGKLAAIAAAQHIDIGSATSDVASLRAAIIDGTAQRIADRRAAAS